MKKIKYRIKFVKQSKIENLRMATNINAWIVLVIWYKAWRWKYQPDGTAITLNKIK